jgi:MerR family redox-sensitive transcriptional activator SoxR
MSVWNIGEVAKQTGLRASAIRYYERLGLLPEPHRSGGRRQYGPKILDRIALLQFARSVGFTIAEIRQLVRGFPEDTPAPARWRKMAVGKIEEMDAVISRARLMKTTLEAVLNCRCNGLDECARRIAVRRTQAR